MITELFNDSDNPSDYYKIIFHTSLNNVINDLNVRFGKEQEYLPLLCRLIPIKCNELLDEEIQKLLVKYGFFLNCTKLELRKEISIWCRICNEMVEKPHAAIAALDVCDETFLPNIFKLLTITSQLQAVKLRGFSLN